MKKLYLSFLLTTIFLLSAHSIGFSQPTCSGAGCQGQNPVTTHCTDDGQWLSATPLNINGQNVGYVQFVYSPTCGTVWSRISTTGTYSATNFSAFLKFSSGLNTLLSSGVPYNQMYSPTQVVNTDHIWHRDSFMLHVSDTRFINQGVKAYGTVGTVFVNKFTPLGSFWVKPSDLP